MVLVTLPLPPGLQMSLSGIQIHVLPPQKWLSAVLKMHPHTVNGFCKSELFFKKSTQPPPDFPPIWFFPPLHQETMQEIVLFPVIWHTFDKHKAKPVFLLSWSHLTQDKVNRGSAIILFSSEADYLLVSTTLVCRYTTTGSTFSALTPPVRHQQFSFNTELNLRAL